MRPTLRQLEYLVAVDDHQHIGRAADACHVSQPSLSAQLKELERHLGAAITERVGRGITMTTVGREIAAQARRILRDTDDLVETANRSATHFVAALRLAAIPTVAPYLLPRVLPAMRRAHPDLTSRQLIDRHAPAETVRYCRKILHPEPPKPPVRR